MTLPPEHVMSQYDMILESPVPTVELSTRLWQLPFPHASIRGYNQVDLEREERLFVK